MTTISPIKLASAPHPTPSKRTPLHPFTPPTATPSPTSRTISLAKTSQIRSLKNWQQQEEVLRMAMQATVRRKTRSSRSVLKSWRSLRSLMRALMMRCGGLWKLGTSSHLSVSAWASVLGRRGRFGGGGTWCRMVTRTGLLLIISLQVLRAATGSIRMMARIISRGLGLLRAAISRRKGCGE